MQERRRQGLCYNCDEQYVRGHVCPRLFFLEVDDFLDVDEEAAADDAAAASPEDVAAAADAHAHALVVSVHALAGIRTYQTMLLPVTIKGERLLALLDTSSTHVPPGRGHAAPWSRSSGGRPASRYGGQRRARAV
jgi:hypothetical protein